jgi:hypothetical protein
MGAEAVVVGRVANGGCQWTAQGEIVVDEQAPQGHDHADCFGERLGFAERPLEIAEEIDERDIDRLGHELRLAARKEAPSNDPTDVAGGLGPTASTRPTTSRPHSSARVPPRRTGSRPGGCFGAGRSGAAGIASVTGSSAPTVNTVP